MLRFFRKFRLSNTTGSRVGRYFFYALGEIILVTIGILIALQVNEWNNKRINELKETEYLFEIQENLESDTLQINKILEFNTSKGASIDSAFYYMSIAEQNPLVGKYFTRLFPVITNEMTFQPKNVAFQNIVSSGNIELIQSNALRKTISAYYAQEPTEGIDRMVRNTTQQLLDVFVPLMISKAMLQANTGLDFDVNRIDETTYHKNPKALAQLLILKNKTMEQSRVLKSLKEEIENIISAINQYIETST